MMKSIQTVVETFTDEQITALLEACQHEYTEHLRLRDECIIHVLLTTGIRAKERPKEPHSVLDHLFDL